MERVEFSPLNREVVLLVLQIENLKAGQGPVQTFTNLTRNRCFQAQDIGLNLAKGLDQTCIRHGSFARISTTVVAILDKAEKAFPEPSGTHSQLFSRFRFPPQLLIVRQT